MEISYYFLPLIALIGLSTSFTDIKKKKIKNTHLLGGLAAGLFLYLYLSWKGSISINFNFLINLGIALIISFLLYLFRIWPAGDAKLFLLFSFLFYGPNSLKTYPSLFLFTNIAISGALFVAIDLILRKFIPSPEETMKIIASKKNLEFAGQIFIIIFSLSWLARFLIMKAPSFHFLFIVLIYLSYALIYGAIEKMKKRKLLALALILLTGLSLRFIFQRAILFHPYYLFLGLKQTLIFIVIYTVFLENKNEFLSKKMKISDLYPGLRAASKFYDSKGKQVVKEGEILNYKKVAELKKLAHNREIEIDSLPIREPLSFAPLIFLGVLLSYTNFLVYLLNLI